MEQKITLTLARPDAEGLIKSLDTASRGFAILNRKSASPKTTLNEKNWVISNRKTRLSNGY